MSTTSNAAARRPLTLSKAAKNTLEGSTLVKASRSPQVHVLPAGKTRTLCAIETTKWASQPTVIEDGKITCPLCAEALKAAAKEAKEAANAASDEADETAESPGDVS
jgi:hypothetical protein